MEKRLEWPSEEGPVSTRGDIIRWWEARRYRNQKQWRTTLTQTATAPPKPIVVPQACAAGQIWDGIQCVPIGAQQCLPGQVGPSCQVNCSIATAGAQNYIELLRMARQEKDRACTQNLTQECQQAESNYNLRLNEYRAFLGGVSTTCVLPDPTSI